MSLVVHDLIVEAESALNTRPQGSRTGSGGDPYSLFRPRNIFNLPGKRNRSVYESNCTEEEPLAEIPTEEDIRSSIADVHALCVRNALHASRATASSKVALPMLRCCTPSPHTFRILSVLSASVQVSVLTRLPRRGSDIHRAAAPRSGRFALGQHMATHFADRHHRRAKGKHDAVCNFRTAFAPH